jgi:hypothetical protein
MLLLRHLGAYVGPASISIRGRENMAKIINKGMSNALRIKVYNIVLILNKDDSVPSSMFEDSLVEISSIPITIFNPMFFLLFVSKIP